MLIREFILQAVRDHRLTVFRPRYADGEPARSLLVSDEVARLIDGPWDAETEARRAGRLRADLEHFVNGGVISVSMTPRRAGSAFMARLEPLGSQLWDVRSRDPSPAIRVVGAFSETDVFVALVWAFRSSLKSNQDWQQLIQQCQGSWRALFSTLLPHGGDDVRDYISRDAFLSGHER